MQWQERGQCMNEQQKTGQRFITNPHFRRLEHMAIHPLRCASSRDSLDVTLPTPHTLRGCCSCMVHVNEVVGLTLTYSISSNTKRKVNYVFLDIKENVLSSLYLCKVKKCFMR